MHDEAKYLDPSVFNPGRFFDDQGNLNDDTVSYVFGFGRRVCTSVAVQYHKAPCVTIS